MLSSLFGMLSGKEAETTAVATDTPVTAEQNPQRIFGFVALQNNGKYMVMSPKGDKRYFVDRELIHSHKLQLGDFCYFLLDAEQTPYNLRKAFHGDKNLTVVVGTNEPVMIKNTYGFLRKMHGGLFYETRSFGLVACLDKNPKLLGRVKINLRLLVDHEKTGAFTNATWGAQSAEIDEKIPDLSNVTKKMNNVTLRDDVVNVSHDEASDEDEIPIFGLVVEKRNTDTFIVWTKESLAGNDVILNEDEDDLKIGEWVAIYVPKSEYGIYFPTEKHIDTPQYHCESYRKITPLHDTEPTNDKKSVVVNLYNVKMRDGHKSGEDITDPILGHIHDKQKMIPNGPCEVSLQVERNANTEKGAKTVWNVVKARIIAQDIKKKQEPKTNIPKVRDTRKNSKNTAKKAGPSRVLSKNGSDEDNEKKTVTNKANKETKIVGSGFEKQNTPNAYTNNMFPYMGLPGFMGAPIMGNSMVPPMVPPMGAAPNFYGLPMPLMMQLQNQNLQQQKQQQQQQQQQPKGAKTAKIVGKGFGSELHVKRAMVTKKKSTKESTTIMYFLWLLDDHVSAIYYAQSDVKLAPGHFFEGEFKKTPKNTWLCSKYSQGLPSLIEGKKYYDTVELNVTVSVKFMTEGMPATRHEFLGEIVDNQKKLPRDCSDGVEIAVRQHQVLSQFRVWVVVSVLNEKDKRDNLINAFAEAWQIPKVKKIVEIHNPNEFRQLDKHYADEQNGSDDEDDEY